MITFPKLPLTLCAAVFLAAMAAWADESPGVRFTGKIDTVAAGSGVGNWTIAGRTVVVTRDTEIETGNGAAIAGACVDVRGSSGIGKTVQATSISTRPAAKCDAATSTVEIFGVVESLPANGVLGDWKVSGTMVRVTAETKIEQDGGPLSMGACVEVKGTSNPDASITASQIEVSAGISGCLSPASRVRFTFRGTVQVAPAAGADLWIIAGRKVAVSSSTQITPGGRMPAVASCVEVQGLVQADRSVAASRVQVLGNGVCVNGLVRQADVAFTGVITALPERGLTGVWSVGGLQVTVTAETRLEADNTTPVPGVCVEVKGDFGASNSVTATRIETRPVGACQGAPGAFRFDGLIETLPAPGSLPGTWKIGGRTVLTDAATVLDTAKGGLMVGACTSVNGALQFNGSVVATRIEVLSASGSCILTGGVVGAGNLSGMGVAPGQIVSIFGQQIGPATVLPLDIFNGQVSNSLGSTRVLFDGTPATLLFVSDSQINAIVPCNVAAKSSVRVQVETSGAWTNIVTLPVFATYPSLFTQNANGTGPGAILNFSTGGYSLNTAGNAAARGGTVLLFGTGEGETAPACEDGQLTSLTGPFPVPVAPVSVEVGGKPATVVYAGGAPGLVRGLFQMNVVLASDTPVGPAIQVSVKIGERMSQAGVTIAVK